MTSTQDPAAGLPFTVGLRGFDRAQVAEALRRYDEEFLVLTTDRNSAIAQAHEVAELLDEAQDEIDRLRRDVDILSVAPTTPEGASDRISRMMRLASDEASEVRARANADAAEMISLAAQHAARDRDELLAQARADIAAAQADRDAAAEALAQQHERAISAAAEHAATLGAAQVAAQQIIERAEDDAHRAAELAAAHREKLQSEFDEALTTRRAEAIVAVAELERTAAAEATATINDANDQADEIVTSATVEAEAIMAAATSQADDIVAAARELAEQTVELARASADATITAAESAAAELTTKATVHAERMSEMRAKIRAELSDAEQRVALVQAQLSGLDDSSFDPDLDVPAPRANDPIAATALWPASPFSSGEHALPRGTAAH